MRRILKRVRAKNLEAELLFVDLMKEYVFILKKARRRYLAQTITDGDYTDNIALLANTPTQADSRLDSLEQAASGIGLYVNADRTKYMCFNKKNMVLWN